MVSGVRRHSAALFDVNSGAVTMISRSNRPADIGGRAVKQCGTDLRRLTIAVACGC